MEKGFGEESPGFRVSDLASKVTNVDGKMWRKDGKPFVARRNIIHNTDVGSNAYKDESKPGNVEAKKTAESSGGNENTGNVNVASGKDGLHEMHENVDTSHVEEVNPYPTFASIVMNSKSKAKTNFRKVMTTPGPNGAYEAMIPISSVKEVASRLDNSTYGYFIGKRIAFPVVDNYVRNAWAKYGIQKVMMNANGFYFFKFNSSKGVEDVLENGPWMIRTVPIILNKWTSSACLSKENHGSVPVWVKVHDIPITAFMADGLSVIASQIGNP